MIWPNAKVRGVAAAFRYAEKLDALKWRRDDQLAPSSARTAA
jgi:hypothetical protein